MSEQVSKLRHRPEDDTTRTVKTHHTRQSSISKSTISSESRSSRQRDEIAVTPLVKRQSSLKRAPKTTNPFVSSGGVTCRALSSSLSDSNSQHPRFDKSSSISDLANLRTSSARVKPSLYVSSHSVSSNSISQTSPRRAGLGARTISPVELKRSKRNSVNIDGNSASVVSSGNLNALRKVSGIPSPVKPPLLSRSRPSPVPPVPPLPTRMQDLSGRRMSPAKFDAGSRSISNPVHSTRQRSATLASSTKQIQSNRSLESEKTSFTSPVKRTKGAQTRPVKEGTQLQPLTLPPMNLHGLSTPTVKRVNDMSRRLQSSKAHSEDRSTNMASTLEGSRRHPSTKKGTGQLQNFDDAEVALEEVPTNTSTVIDSEEIKVNSNLAGPSSYGNATSSETLITKTKDVNGFFGRLSLSRSSSSSKLKKKQSLEQSDYAEDITVPEPSTPERRRRLSLSWMKGKMSPFNNPTTTPKVDHGIPPAIPKSFTSESLASLASQTDRGDVSAHSKAAEDTPNKKEALALQNTSMPMDSLSSSAERGTLLDKADEEMRKLLTASRGTRYLTDLKARADSLDAKAVCRNPVDAADTATLEGCPLNLYEKGEAIDYDGKIYFTGKRGLQKTGGRLDSALNINFGYDDDRGDYLINAGDHFAYRYEIVDVLGKGSFGQVLRCIDYKTGGLVAVKVIRNKQRFHAQALIEVKILKMLRTWVSQKCFGIQHKLILLGPA